MGLGRALHATDEGAHRDPATPHGRVPPLLLPADRSRSLLINPILRGWVGYFRVGHSVAVFGMSKIGGGRRFGAI
ncbi:group II intron maturase-specific domain-containing protein [Thiocapsa sp.]|uniref:group II intron maturase-specific domain-containing protein n=1 Tax=Thiocapsa sp. TaxID=2024551 RepID=UPI001BCB56ED